MCQKQLALLVEHLFLAAPCRKTDVFERQPRKRKRPVLLRYKRNKRWLARQHGMPCLRRKAVTVARGARLRVTEPACRHNDRLRGKKRTACPHARYGAVRITDRTDCRIQANIDAGISNVSFQCAQNVARLIRRRKHPAPPFRFERHAERFDKPLDGLIIKRRKRAVQKSRVVGDSSEKRIALRAVGHIAAAFARNVKLFAEFFIPFKQGDRVARARRFRSRDHAGGSPAHNADSHGSTPVLCGSVM